ncbi:hypothetical protein BDR04DRAFT_1164692 [Suillus decipiens]|nr:hypothetical protein BDR04DRAFT_1164692 [Suillus decipiens]
MLDSPPESPILQPVQAPPPLDDFPDNAYEQDQGSFEPLQLPRTMEKKLHQKTGDVSYATKMESTNVKIALGSHSTALAVARVNIIAILPTGSVNGMIDSSSRAAWLMLD